MLREMIADIPFSSSTLRCDPRSDWEHEQQDFLRHTNGSFEHLLDRLPEKTDLIRCSGAQQVNGVEEDNPTQDEGFLPGRSLYQESFFFCTVKKIGDLPGVGCIYVETVVDGDSGFAFAKVYSAGNAANAVDILESRVLPFFESRHLAIEAIHTRKTSEYCGLPTVHSFESFLASSKILHLSIEQPWQPCSSLCEKFYRHLLRQFFLPVLRRQFCISLENVQNELDKFVETYNSRQLTREGEIKLDPAASTNFTIHP